MITRKRLEDLQQWRLRAGRKPLIIRGARQVGKTTIVNQFAQSFEQYLYLNLEKQRDANFFHSYQDATIIAQQLFLAYGLDYTKREQTLLFIDEIQEVPSAINMLRYFYEELPELPVIAAGSMLETLLGKRLTFPVGRVSYLMLRPLSFEEVFRATATSAQFAAFEQVPISPIAENLLHEKFIFYAFTGGMPAVIQNYLENKDITQLQPIFEELLESYLDDAEKYAQSSEQLNQLRFVIQQIGKEAGSRISFTNFGGQNYPVKKIAALFYLLEKTHLCQLIYPVVGQQLPLEKDSKKAPRLHILDTGLMNFVANIQIDVLRSDDLCSVYKGKMIEHLIGQELFSTLRYPSETPNFWVRQKRGSQAEIDYLYPFEGKLYPVEVKSGKKGTLKSLMVYMETAPVTCAIRIYGGKFSVDTLEIATGTTIHLLNIPFFHTTKINEYLTWFFNDYQQTEEKSSSLVSEPAEKYLKKGKQPAELSTQVRVGILKACVKEAKSARYLLETILGVSFQTHNKRKFIQPLLAQGYLAQTQTENKKSKLQTYQITAIGKTFLTEQNKQS